MNELSDTKLRNAKPANKEYTIADGHGLSVAVRPNGTKLWLYCHRFGGKRNQGKDHLLQKPWPEQPGSVPSWGPLTREPTRA
jgi:hypothetical protein